ncbi:aminoglycoside phosphotransferase [Nocardia sp. BMG51109]|uniref:aminoglycoside phosphotransferase n=1 Tax=Nocardia sp. BMG51109 TaxID=1056816 RepID=UPI0012EB32CF|nr:aminoglycoside phosphotransferase [Nocardia sp. BMG51109]
MTVDRAQTSAQRRSWEELPQATRTAAEALTGPVLRAESIVAGFSSHLATVLETAEGRTFVKGMRVDDPEVWTQHREAVLGPHVTPIGPRLRWQVAAGGWDLLGFDYVPGHFADYRVDADLAATAAAMAALGRLPCPAELELKDAEVRWGGYLADPADAARFAGETLLHTDWNYSNVIVTETGARLVDWPWATRGASWIDPGCWIVWLIFAGHEPAAAERWAARVPAWHRADTTDLRVFATALAAEWTATANRNPNIWTHGLRDAARRWADHHRRP